MRQPESDQMRTLVSVLIRRRECRHRLPHERRVPKHPQPCSHISWESHGDLLAPLWVHRRSALSPLGTVRRRVGRSLAHRDTFEKSTLPFAQLWNCVAIASRSGWISDDSNGTFVRAFSVRHKDGRPRADPLITNPSDGRFVSNSSPTPDAARLQGSLSALTREASREDLFACEPTTASRSSTPRIS